MELPFLSPVFLLALLAAPFVAVGLHLALRARSNRLQLLGARLDSSRLPIYAPMVVLFCLVIACARPYWGYQEIKLPKLGKDIIAVVDVSYSMLASDVSPSRIEFAKRKLHDLIDLLQRHADGDRLGIVLFAGESYLFCPLTEDYAVLRTFANSIQVGLIASGGSAITQALVTAAKSFQATDAQLPAVLLLSDGEDNDLVIARSLDILRGFKLSLWALGIGTREGKPLTLPGGRLLRDAKGSIVVSKLDESLLQKLAEQSGGSYSRATLDERDLELVLAQFHSTIKTAGPPTASGTLRVFNEFGSCLLWIPLAMLTLLLYQGRSRVMLSLSLALPFAASAAHAQTDASRSSSQPMGAYDAQQAYEDGRYDEAASAFAEILKTDPSNTKALQALAHAEFRQGRIDSAIKHFSELVEQSQSGRDKFYNLYDLGTAEIAAKRYKDAVSHLEQALQIKPGDEAATHNRDVAKQLLEHLPPPSPSPNGSPKPEEEHNEKKEPQNTPEASPSAGPSPTGQPNESHGQDPTPQPENTAQSSTPSTTPSQGEQREGEATDSGDESTPTPRQDPSETGNVTTPSAQSTPSRGAAAGEKHDSRSMEQREAQAWLESLDDSPVLLRRQVGNKRSPQQQSW